MMHYGNLVIIDAIDPEDAPTDTDLEVLVRDAVKSAMGPHEEHGGFWDWYQIGGRWTGVLDGYDPDTDPANREPCDYCEATGTTTAAVAARFPAYREHVGKPCIQCKGTGQRVTWPTQWKFHRGDVASVDSLTPEQYAKFYRLIVDGDRWEKERYEPWREKIADRFQKVDLPPLEWLKKDHGSRWAVVVDNHS